MSRPAAKKGDRVVGLDTHILMVPTPAGPMPTPTPMPFCGELGEELSPNVLVQNKPVAMKGSAAKNAPDHVPAAGSFQKPPANRGTIQTGNDRVLVNNRPIARLGEPAMTCNDPADAPNGTVIADSSVWVGDDA